VQQKHRQYAATCLIMCWRQVDGVESSRITRIVKLTTAVTENPALCRTWRWQNACYGVQQQLPSKGRDIKTIHSQHQVSRNLHLHNSCFECLKLDVMDSPLNCFYQRFVTYLVWRSLKRPVQVTLYNHVLAWCHLISTKDNWMSEVLGTQQCFIVVSVKQHLGGRLVW